MSRRGEELFSLLRELAELTVLDDGDPQSFRARAYENAILQLKSAPGDVAAMSEKELRALDGVGKATAAKVREFFETGRIEKLEKLRGSYPPETQRLAKLPGVGPKSLARLREAGIHDVGALRAAIERKELRELEGFGATSEERLAKAIDRLDFRSKADRVPIAEALPVARRLVEELAAVRGVEAALYCGSLRRLRTTCADVDILVATKRAETVMERFRSLSVVRGVPSEGDTRSSIVTDRGLQVDLRVVEPHQLGAAMLYFTGSKAHNIKLRQLAIQRGWTLNEYGLLDAESGAVVASRTEEEIYEALGLAFVPPPMREDTGEIEAAAEGALPAALAEEALLGDLHVHTDYSGDGRSSLEDTLARAAERSYAYLAITDHAENLAINGVSRERLLEQRARLERLQGEHPGMRMLHGVELNIGPDGSLDYDEAFRASFDWCVAAVHSHFDRSPEEQTRRLITAMRDPCVDVIGHLSGRMIGRRPGIEFDVEAVLRAAAETGTAIEINSALPRLDASWEVLRKARDLPVTFVVSSDAHHTDELTRLQWGAKQAQRGWVDPERVANTWPAERFLGWVRERKAARQRGQTSTPPS
ncbi:MAG: DNA polymerase/3'-5' exonuclease PolX [Myxococcota bacterium]|nr:DNA polymerase/3'-5' exonuclease PolX [Myxococcota bacterium]